MEMAPARAAAHHLHRRQLGCPMTSVTNVLAPFTGQLAKGEKGEREKAYHIKSNKGIELN